MNKQEMIIYLEGRLKALSNQNWLNTEEEKEVFVMLLAMLKGEQE